jgi:hypothetical protein
MAPQCQNMLELFKIYVQFAILLCAFVDVTVSIMHGMNNIEFKTVSSGVYSRDRWRNATTCYDTLSTTTVGVYWTPTNGTVYHEFSWPSNVSTGDNKIFTLWLKIIFHFKNCPVFLAHPASRSERKHYFVLPRYILNNRKKKAIWSSNDPQKQKWREAFLEITKEHVIRIEPCPCQLWGQHASSAIGTTYSFLWGKAART